MAESFPERGFAFYRGLKEVDVSLAEAGSASIRKLCSLEGALSKAALLQTLLRALEAPEDYYRNVNYDSFDEIIRGLEWLEFDVLIVIMTKCSTQWASNYQPMSVVLEICADAVIFWRHQGKEVFFAMVD